MHKTCNIFYVQTFILTLRIQNFLSIMITVSKCMGCSVTCSDNTITPSLFPNNLIEVIHVWLCHPQKQAAFTPVTFLCQFEKMPFFLPVDHKTQTKVTGGYFLFLRGHISPGAHHLQHFLFSTCSTLLQRGQVW